MVALKLPYKNAMSYSTKKIINKYDKECCFYKRIFIYQFENILFKTLKKYLVIKNEKKERKVSYKNVKPKPLRCLKCNDCKINHLNVKFDMVKSVCWYGRTMYQWHWLYLKRKHQQILIILFVSVLWSKKNL